MAVSVRLARPRASHLSLRFLFGWPARAHLTFPGRVVFRPPQVLSLPNYTPSVVTRHVHKHAEEYVELEKAFREDRKDHLRDVFTRNLPRYKQVLTKRERNGKGTNAWTE